MFKKKSNEIARVVRRNGKAVLKCSCGTVLITNSSKALMEHRETNYHRLRSGKKKCKKIKV